MNERTVLLHSFEDLQNVMDEHKPLAMQVIDWRLDLGSLASRRAVVEPFVKDFARQFGETLATLCDVPCDANEPRDAGQIIADTIMDAVSDLYGPEWDRVEEKAAFDASGAGRAAAAAGLTIKDRRAA